MNASGKRFIWHESRADVFKLVYFSDIHYLAKACAEKEVLKTRDEILNDPFTFWIGGGDYGEFIGFGVEFAGDVLQRHCFELRE